MAEDANPAASRGDSLPEPAPSTDAPAKSPESPRAEKEPESAVKADDASADAPAAASEKPEAAAAEPAKTPEKEESAVAEEETAAADTTANGTNGTPASAAKKSDTKRRASGVSKPKGKKLGKKKSMARITHLDAKPGEYYLARLKTHSPWPSIICDEEMLPESLLSTRPVTTKKKDGTYNEPYSDGGKRVQDRTFPIMFLQTNEFAWIPNTDLTPLDPESCKDVSEKGKSKSLVGAYQVAAEGHDLQYFKDMLRDHAQALLQDQQEREARAAEKAAKQEKKKRKSMDVADEQEMAEAGAEKRKSAKKRKKDAGSDVESDKPAKTPKTATKLKLTTPKTPATGETGKKAIGSAKASKAKAASAKKDKKGKAASDEDATETPKQQAKPIDPQEAKLKKEKEVLYLRHKLQKGFLTRDQAPKEEEMGSMSNYIQKLESYSDLEVSIIRGTKINKVLKAIIKLNSIPKDEEYDFRGRAINILNKWKTLLDSDIPSTEKEQPEEKEKEKPKANGHEQANGKPAAAEETTDGGDEGATAAAAADEDTPMPDADAAEKAKTAEDDGKSGTSPAPAKEAEAVEA
ncbi:hypothetical protein FQN55_006429 [Onygenales sp. PD_40]|nr:hypothetical protein FQN55_006429 [Onygenales sp. PD_40]